jgi:hypothetical protein
MKPIKPTKSESLRKHEHKLFGRPQMNADEHRSVKISVFLTQSEAETLKEKSSETLLTLPELLRRAALGRQIEKRKSIFDADAILELRQCVQFLRKVSSEMTLMQQDILGTDYEYIENILREQLRILNSLKNKIIEG